MNTEADAWFVSRAFASWEAHVWLGFSRASKALGILEKETEMTLERGEKRAAKTIKA